MTTKNHNHLFLLLSLFLLASLACNALSPGQEAVEEEPAVEEEAAVEEEPTVAVEAAAEDEPQAEEEAGGQEAVVPQTAEEEEPAAQEVVIPQEEETEPAEMETEDMDGTSPLPAESEPLVYTSDGNPCARPIDAVTVIPYGWPGQAETALSTAGSGDNAGALIARLPHPNLYTAAVTSPGRDLVVTLNEFDADTGAHISIWDAATGQEIYKLDVNEEDHSLATGAHAPFLATMEGKGNVWLWSLADLPGIAGKPVVDTGESGALALSPDGRYLAVSSTDSNEDDNIIGSWSVIDLYDLETGERANRLEGELVDMTPFDEEGNWKLANVAFGHGGAIDALVFSPNGQALLSVSEDDGTMRLWDIASGEQLRCFEFPQYEEAAFASFSTDGREIATLAGSDVLIWDTASSAVSREIDLMGIMGIEMETAFFRPAFYQLITTSEKEKAAYIWDAVNGELLALIRHPEMVTGAAASPDGRWIVTVMRDADDERNNEARIWEADHEALEQAARAQNFVAAAFEASEQGDITAMRSFLLEAESISPTDGFLLRPAVWNRACRDGLFAGQAAAVLDLCDRAVEQADAIAETAWQRSIAARYHDSRGLALAAADRPVDAKPDFKYFADNSSIFQSNDADLRRFWIEEIDQGRNPIDEATLEELRQP